MPEISPEMIEAGAAALANAVGMRRGVPRISNVLDMMPKDLADQFRNDAVTVIEAALADLAPNQFVGADGAVYRLAEFVKDDANG